MRVLVFPLDQNPYQRLLYAAVRRRDPSIKITYAAVVPKIGALHFPTVALVHRLRGAHILHVHWAAFVLPTWMNRQHRLSGLFYRFCVSWARMIGFRIVWTVHNIVPHEPETDDDLRCAKFLAARSDGVIAHSPRTYAAMSALGFEMSRACVIPHGNYRGYYPDGIDRATARHRLGIDDGALVFLYFGIVRPYKGVDDLIRAFVDLGRPDARLFLVGVFLEGAARDAADSISGNDQIRVVDQYVDDADVATYYRAADVACLPYRGITTSGSAVLAQSFGLPIITSAVGDLSLLSEDVALFYEPGDVTALRDRLRKVCDDQTWLRYATKAAAEITDANPWDDSAAPTVAMFRAIEENRKRERRSRWTQLLRRRSSRRRSSRRRGRTSPQ